FPAIYGTTHIEKVSSLGVLETFDAASIIVAADVAAKTSEVELIELRVAKGMCGTSYVYLCGEVSAVDAAIAKSKAAVAESGMYLDSTVIAHPDDQIIKSIL
ncbi:MAG: BMC domain-containing protein, partial [Acetatifactor sp.]|nr:BMC domain-containing protein [Acetatifactor sp.]